MSTVERIYTYERNGKTVIVKRSWTNNTTLTNRRNTLNAYFEANKDAIQRMKNYMAVFNDYNTRNPQHTVSYSTIVNKIHKVFGHKRKHSAANSAGLHHDEANNQTSDDNKQVDTNEGIDSDENDIL